MPRHGNDRMMESTNKTRAAIPGPTMRYVPGFGLHGEVGVLGARYRYGFA